jgi:hypothetical protein
MPFSFLNGLSTMGQGVAQYAGTIGLDMQKAQLIEQQTRLADQLATAREQNVTQPFQASQLAAQQAGALERTKMETGTQLQTAGMQVGASKYSADVGARTAMAQISAELERTRMTLGADPAEIKILRTLGILPPTGNLPAGTTAASGGGGSTPATTTAANAPGTATDAGAAPAAGTSATPDMSPAMQSIINKTMGLPQPGSEDALRRGIAADVAADPAFKYKTAGQKAIEAESRFNVATAKMLSPSSIEGNANAIASYQQEPLSGYARSKEGGNQIMGRVMELNPDYQSSRYPEINKAMSAFGTGKQGDTVRFLNVGVQHLDVLDQAATALGNNDVRALNSLQNLFQTQFGGPAPTTFDAMKQIVGTEIEKAIAGGIGSEADRSRIMDGLSRANSPAQLKGVTDGFRSLMVGQLNGLKGQYEEATGFKSGPFAFENKLAPETKARLQGKSPATAAPDGTADAPLPFPKSAAEAVTGKYYATPGRGTARWDGEKFVMGPQ